MSLPVSQPITTRAELIAFAARLDGVREVGFDTEFHAEQTYWPKVMLLQFATREELVLIDPLAAEIKTALGGFLELFRMRGQTLVGHALEKDLEIFMRLNGGLPTRIFDTQIAAALVGHGGPVGLSLLLSERLGVDIDKLYSQADWGRRPLPPAQAEYAADDVRYILGLADALRDEVRERGREAWLEAEHGRLLDPEGLMPPDPDEAWRRVGRRPQKGTPAHAVLEALAAERERIAKETDKPPRRVLPDDVLVDLARRAPGKKADVDVDTRRRPAPNLERYATRWLEAVRSGLERAPEEVPQDAPSPSPDARATAELAKVLARWIFEREEVSSWLLPSLDGPLLEVAVSAPTAPEGLRQALGLEGWRAELLLEALWGFFARGQRLGVEPDGEGLRVVLTPAEQGEP